MSKYRAWALTAVIMTLLGVVIWLMWDYAMRSFWVIALIFAFYGFFSCTVNLGRMLQAPSWIPERPRRGAHSMEEADAALWEKVDDKAEKAVAGVLQQGKAKAEE